MCYTWKYTQSCNTHYVLHRIFHLPSASADTNSDFDPQPTSVQADTCQ